jgi:hypothetical protein
MRLESGWKLGAWLALLALCACAAPAEDPSVGATVATDEFSKYVEIAGPLMYDYEYGVYRFYALSTNIDKVNHQYLHLLVVELSYNSDDPINFQFAADDTAQDLQLIRTGRDRKTCPACNRGEGFQIVIPDAALRSHVATGYRVKLSSLRGNSIILAVSPAMIAKQFAGLDAYLKTVTAPVPGAAIAAPAVLAVPTMPKTAHETPREPRHLGIEYQQTIKIGEIAIVYVEPGSPADEAGLQAEDILLSYDGHPISDESDVRELVDDTEPGSVVRIEIRRGRERLTLTAQM